MTLDKVQKKIYEKHIVRCKSQLEKSQYSHLMSPFSKLWTRNLCSIEILILKSIK
jgi:hypothetical protein